MESDDPHPPFFEPSLNFRKMAVANTSSPGVLYLSTIHTAESKSVLERAITLLLTALAAEDGPASQCLYQLYYEQKSSTRSTVAGDDRILEFSTPRLSLAFDDSILEPVQQVWSKVMPEAAADENVQYMVFADREGVGDEDDYE